MENTELIIPAPSDPLKNTRVIFPRSDFFISVERS